MEAFKQVQDNAAKAKAEERSVPTEHIQDNQNDAHLNQGSVQDQNDAVETPESGSSLVPGDAEKADAEENDADGSIPDEIECNGQIALDRTAAAGSAPLLLVQLPLPLLVPLLHPL
jgi:hypothetical protein